MELRWKKQKPEPLLFQQLHHSDMMLKVPSPVRRLNHYVWKTCTCVFSQWLLIWQHTLANLSRGNYGMLCKLSFFFIQRCISEKKYFCLHLGEEELRQNRLPKHTISSSYTDQTRIPIISASLCNSPAEPCESSSLSPILKPSVLIRPIRLQFAFSINARI